jgi:hypothetical protein
MVLYNTSQSQVSQQNVTIATAVAAFLKDNNGSERFPAATPKSFNPALQVRNL